ncbi:MAG: hypothetical protein WC747_01045 [Candidatus Babeliales bacterium]|jgi:DNA-binding Xre family transcriptional regulator
MNKKITKKAQSEQIDTTPKTTSERLYESMTPKQRQKYDEEYQELLLSELLIAITNQKELSVRKLAKEAGVSPAVIQSMRSGDSKDYSLKIFFKVLKGLGCKKFTVTTEHGKNLHISLPSTIRKN